MSEEKKKIYLSSSRIDTLETCSWTYYCKYHLKLPDKTNDGALRGSACHELLECLCEKKRLDFVKEISSSFELFKENKLINRFLRRKYKKLGLNPEAYVDKKVTKKTRTNHELVLEMLYTAITFEFVNNRENRKIIQSEHEFCFENENPRYAIRGFIDRVSEIKENGEQYLEVLDYKSSKAKFSGDKASANLQAMIYTLVAKKRWPNYKKYIANFFFMRFPKDPYVKSEYGEDELSGLEHYLEYLTEQLENFDHHSAFSNFAAHNEEKSWLCGRGSWVCPFKNEFDFYQVLNSKDEIVIGFYEYSEAEDWVIKNKKNENDFKIEMKKYEGCPAWKKDLTFE